MKFFVLNLRANHAKNETEFYATAPENLGEAMRCPRCHEFITGLPWLPPFVAELELWHEDFGDIVFGANEEILVSDRFRQFWAESLLTGLSGFHPVKVKRVKRHRRKEAKQTEVPPYFFVDIARTRTAIDLRASGFVFDSNEDVCPECLTGGIIKKFDRIVIEPSTWTGEDIFIARGLPGTILVSERFKAFRDENDISNAYLVPVEEFGIKF